jgi:hypothetical protein
MNFLKNAAIAVAVVAATPAMATETDSVTQAYAASGSFSESYSYTMPFTGYLSTVLSSAQTKLLGKYVAATNVDFTSAVLTANGVNYTLTTNSSGAVENRSWSDVFMTAGTTATLALTGTAGSAGSYTVSFSSISGAVPEASTWIMMILGFGITAMAMRKRQAGVLAAA